MRFLLDEKSVLLGWAGGEGIKGLHSAVLRQKKLQNLRPVESYIKIQRLRHHQESQVAIEIDSRP